jgi:methylenetetrahydrofolate--tRNA-(uracil-5-)-methyltransferase
VSDPEQAAVDIDHAIRIYLQQAGNAGFECAWQLAEMGHQVVLIEMRAQMAPKASNSTADLAAQYQNLTPAHKTDQLAELVCSNSLGSQTDYSAPGQLKWEAEKLGSLILKAAKEASVPAGMALGVDREVFARSITHALESHPRIRLERRVIKTLDDVPRPAVIATGPLTHDSLAQSIREHLSYGEMSANEYKGEAADGLTATPGQAGHFLYFFDAIAPIVDVDTINMDIVWRENRFGRDGNSTRNKPKSPQDVDSANIASADDAKGDYLNCPMTKEQYFGFIEAIQKARKIEPKDFEKIPYFDGCMPIETMVERGPLTPRFGPMSPKGLTDPHTGKRPYAVVQLRQENREGTAYNMVGFQTKMAYADQKEVFRLIPGLENAEFLKLGSIHRNMYIHTPHRLSPHLSSKRDPQLFFAGQITGVEGYFDSTCIGLLVARFLNDQLRGKKINLPPRESALGSLLNGITEYKEQFQPTNINFGLFPIAELQLQNPKDRAQKREAQLNRAKTAILNWIS